MNNGTMIVGILACTTIVYLSVCRIGILVCTIVIPACTKIVMLACTTIIGICVCTMIIVI